MSGSTLPGVAFSGLTPTPQAQDADTTLLLQDGMFRQVSTRAMVCSYTPSGAVLLAAGAGASRGAAPGTVPTAGDPMQAVALHATITMLPPLEVGGAPILAATVGTTAGTVAAGNDPRIANAAQIDPDGNLTLQGHTLSLAAGGLTITSDNAGNVTMIFNGPTTDPGVAGRLWNNAGLLAISAGLAS